jgi:PAS domain S-box-containing protein
VGRLGATLRQLRSTGGWAGALVLVLGLGASLVAAGGLRHAENRSAQEVMDKRVTTVRQAVASEAQRYVDALQLVAGGLGASDALDADTFLSTTAPLRQLGLHGAFGITFVVPVLPGKLADTQAYWRAHGADDLTLKPASTNRTEHYFSIFQRTLDGSVARSGVDVSQSGEATGALLLSRRLDQPVVSDPYVLLHDRDKPARQQQLSFVLVAPVYSQTTGLLLGWITMGLRGHDFIDATLRSSADGLKQVSLQAQQNESKWLDVADLQLAAGRRDLHRTVDAAVADRTWRLSVDTSQITLLGRTTHLDAAALATGIAVSLLIALLVFTQVTARGRAQCQVATATADLRASEEQLRLLLDGARDYAIFLLDPRGHVASWSANAERLKGYRAEEIIGRHYGTFFTPEEAAAGDPDMLLQDANARGAVQVHGVRVRKDGSRFWGHGTLTVARNEDGSVRGFVEIMQDVTERQRSEAKYRGLLEVAPDAILGVDIAGRIIVVNARAEELFGYDRDDLYGQFVDLLVPSETAKNGEVPLRPSIAGFEVADRPSVAGVEVEAHRADGTRFPAEISLSTLDTEEGVIISAAIRDISERKAAQRAIQELNDDLERRVDERTRQLAQQAEQLRETNAELESFSYSVSHDLRAPLRAVDGFAKMLALDHEAHLDAEGRRYLDRIRAGAQQMGQLIDGLLAFSRLQRQAMAWQPVHMRAILDDVWEELAVDRVGRDIVLNPHELPTAFGDARLVRHVMSNLLSNAIKYTRERPHAEIEVGCLTPPDGVAAFYVRDNGAGFDMRYADKLFRVFQRLHRAEEYEGTGIGLALANRIVQRHGGRMWADAELGSGATFYFTLPIEEVVDEAPADAGVAGGGQSRRSGAGAARV